MRGMLIALASAMSALAAANAGQAEQPKAPHILVLGMGHVLVPPDIADLVFKVRGEGASPDAATVELVNMRQEVERGLSGLPATALKTSTAEMTLLPVRGSNCSNEYASDRAHLSVGDCAVQGYVAELTFKVRLSPPSLAGTAAGLAGRLGALDVRVSDFSVSDSHEAMRQASVAAFSDARQRAEAIANASGVRLGPILSVTDQDSEEVELTVTASRNLPLVAPAIQARPPVRVDLKPEPIKVEAKLNVTYAINP